MSAAVLQIVEPEAQSLLDAQRAGCATSSAEGELTIESVRAELDEEGGARVVTERHPITLPSLGMHARLVGVGPRRHVLVYGLAGRTFALSMTFPLTREDLVAINALLPIDPTREALAGAIARQGVELEAAMRRIQTLEEENAHLGRTLELLGSSTPASDATGVAV